MDTHHLRSATNLSDRAWALLEPVLPPASPIGRPRHHALRTILTAICFELRTGGAWRFLPQDWPPWQTVSHYFRRKRHVLVDTEGLLQAVNVHAADSMDRDAIKLVRSEAVRAQLPRMRLPWMQLLWLDAGDSGRGKGKDWVEQTTTWRGETVTGMQWRRYSWAPNDIPPAQIDWSLIVPVPASMSFRGGGWWSTPAPGCRTLACRTLACRTLAG
jgi:transposase